MAKQSLGKAVLELSTEDTNFQKGMGGARKAATQFDTQLKRVGDSAARTGARLTRTLTLAIAGFAAAVTKMAGGYEASMTKIVGLVGVAREQVDQWSDDLLKLGPALGKKPKELADALFFITSAGLRGAEAMDTLVASAKASAAGLGETKVVADAATSALNAYGSENITASEAVDVLTATVREGKAEADAIAGSMGRIIPLASHMGVSFDQVGAAIAAMTRLGSSADESVTSLQAILSSLLKPAQQSEEALRSVGLSAAKLRDVIRKDGLLAGLQLLDKAIGGNDELLGQIIPNVRALRGAMGLLGENAEETAEIFESLADSTGAGDEAFEAMADTIDQRINVALANINAAFIKLGNVLKPVVLPIFEKFGETVNRIADWFSELNPGMQRFIIYAAGVAAALGPALFIFGKIVTAFAAIKTAIIAAKVAMIAFTGTVMANPIGLAIVAAAGLGLAIVGLVRNMNKAHEVSKNWRDDLKDLNTELTTLTETAERSHALQFKTIESIQAAIDKTIEVIENAAPGSIIAQGQTKYLEALKQRLAEVEAAAEGAAAGTDDMRKSWVLYKDEAKEGLEEGFEILEQQALVAEELGEDFDLAGKKIKLVRKEIDRLLSIPRDEIAGFFTFEDENGYIQNLIDLIEELRESLEKPFQAPRLPVPTPSELEIEDWLHIVGVPPPPPAATLPDDPFLKIADVLTAFMGTLEGAAGSLASIAVAGGEVALVIFGLSKIFEGMMSILGPLINQALAPLFGILVMWGRFIGTILSPIFKGIADIAKFLGEAFVWLYNNVFLHIGRVLTGAFALVWDIIAGIANGIIMIFNAVIDGVNKIPFVNIKHIRLLEILDPKEEAGQLEAISIDELMGIGEESMGLGDDGGSPSIFEQQRPIYVTVDVHDNEYFGEGSWREFALTVRDELEEIGALGI